MTWVLAGIVFIVIMLLLDPFLRNILSYESILIKQIEICMLYMVVNRMV